MRLSDVWVWLGDRITEGCGSVVCRGMGGDRVLGDKALIVYQAVYIMYQIMRKPLKGIAQLLVQSELILSK